MANIVSQNPSVSEVKAALAEPSYSVGGLCTSKKINKWSRWKPIRSQKKGDINETDIIISNGGISIPQFTTLTQLINYYRGLTANQEIWVYEKPLGDSSSPYRLGDFRNYSKDAFRFYNFSGYKQTIYPSDTVTKISINIEGVNSEYNLEWESLNLLDYFFGALIVPKTSNTNIKSDVEEDDFSSFKTTTAYDANIPTLNLSVGNYDLYTFAAKKQSGAPVLFIPLEGGMLGDVLVKLSRLSVILSGQIIASGSSYNVPWTLNIENTSADTQLIKNVHIRLKYRYSNVGDTDKTGEARFNIGDVQVNASSTFTQTGTFTNVLQNLSTEGNGAYLYFGNTTDLNLNRMYEL